MKAFWQVVSVVVKSQSCLCMQTSKAEPDFSGYMCVRECVGVCFWDNNRRFVCGLYTVEDNVGWQVCVDQTLHRQPPALPFFCLCSIPVHLSPPTLPPPPPQGKSWLSPLLALCQCSFVRWGWNFALCVPLYTHHAQLFTDWLCEHLGIRDRGGGWGGCRWSMDQP